MTFTEHKRIISNVSTVALCLYRCGPLLCCPRFAIRGRLVRTPEEKWEMLKICRVDGQQMFFFPVCAVGGCDGKMIGSMEEPFWRKKWDRTQEGKKKITKKNLKKMFQRPQNIWF